MQRFRQLAILKNKDRKQMWKTIKTLDAKEQEIEEIGRTLISAMIYWCPCVTYLVQGVYMETNNT